MLDLIIIGAGPAGISAAYEAKKHGLNYLVIEKGLIGNTIYQYPVGLTVFSTTNELEFEPGGLHPARDKPTREELLSYYVRFVLDNELNVRTEEEVLKVVRVREPSTTDYSDSTTPTSQSLGHSSLDKEGSFFTISAKGVSDENSPPEFGGVAAVSADGVVSSLDKIEREHDAFRLTTSKSEYVSRAILFATGAMDYPRKLGIPGEDLPKVHDHFRETYPWVRKRALVVGGGNSAGEAALFLAEEGADATLAIFRSDWENTDPKQGCIKYWVKQPLEAELKKHCLKLFFLGKVVEITEDAVVLEDENGVCDAIPNDVVFVLIGADADLGMLKSLGVETMQGGKYGEVPVYDESTFETNVPGVYVAGHFTNQRHIKGAIDAGKALIPGIVARVNR